MENKEFYIAEFERLKEEQLKRIEFRDHMIYLTLVAIASTFAFAYKHSEYDLVFLVLPLFNIIMAWTYYTNDRKISAIGSYLKDELIPKITGEKSSWEIYRLKRKDRFLRKLLQLFIDLILYIGTAFYSLYIFISKNNSLNAFHYVLIGLIIILLITLTVLFIKASHK